MDAVLVVLVIAGLAFVAGLFVGVHHAAGLTKDMAAMKADLSALKAKLP